MFCARCGQQIPDASEICPLCGREATVKLIPVSEPVAFNQPQFRPVATPAIHGPSGVGGWLLFYCVSTAVLTPAAILINMSRLSFPATNLYYWFDVARICFGAVVGGMLWSRLPGSLRWLRICFIFDAAAIALNALRTIETSLREHRPFFEGEGFTRLTTSAGSVLVWFAYFCMSVRVRNTYGANLWQR